MNLSPGLRLISLTSQHVSDYVQFLHQIIDEVHPDNDWARSAVKEHYSIRRLRETRRNPQAYCPIVLDDQDNCVGIGFCHYEGGLGRVDWVCVGPDQRGKGIGSRLLKAMSAFFLLKNCHRIELTTYLGREDLRSFYEKHGFSVAATLPNHRYGIDIWYMIRNLAVVSNLAEAEEGMEGSGG